MQNKLAERSTWNERRLYQQHKDNLKNAKSKVDSEAPMLDVGAFYNTSTMMTNVARLTQIDNDNFKLIKQVNKIYRYQGKIDCFKPKESDKKVPNTLPKGNEEKKIFIENIELLTKIIYVKPRIDFGKFEKDRKKNYETLLSMSRYPEHYEKRKKFDPLIVNTEILYNVRIKKSKCYLDITNLTENRLLGRLIIELYDGVVPKTALNFRTLCRQQNNRPGYRGTQFFRINPELFCLGGDVEYSIGLGGVSAFAERYFDDENYLLSHNASGTLSMYSFEKNKNASQFLITFKPLRILDGNHVVFGRVIRGLNTLKMIEDSGFPSGRPKHKIIIKECGQYTDYC